MVVKINPDLITDDMMYEGAFVPAAELEAWANEYEQEMQTTLDRVKEDKLWGEIRNAAKTNKTLQEAIDHVIMIYKLSKEYKDGI